MPADRATPPDEGLSDGYRIAAAAGPDLDPYLTALALACVDLNFTRAQAMALHDRVVAIRAQLPVAAPPTGERETVVDDVLRLALRFRQADTIVEEETAREDLRRYLLRALSASPPVRPEGREEADVPSIVRDLRTAADQLRRLRPRNLGKVRQRLAMNLECHAVVLEESLAATPPGRGSEVTEAAILRVFDRSVPEQSEHDDGCDGGEDCACDAELRDIVDTHNAMRRGFKAELAALFARPALTPTEGEGA